MADVAKNDDGTDTKVLNLYAGIGGNRKLWGDVDVTAVEINPDVAAEYRNQHPNDDVIVTDAHEFLRKHYDDGWDFIWSSPPCQTHSQISYAAWHSDTGSNINRNAEYPDMRLYQEVILLKNLFNGEWVVENVKPYYDTLIPAQTVGRHNLWSNFIIPQFDEPTKDFEFDKCDVEDIEDWLGFEMQSKIYLDGNHDPAQVLRNCVHPKLGEHVFDAATTDRQATLADL